MRLNVKPGITGAALPDNTAVVVLDTKLNPELIAEGLVNDAMRFIQDSRKTLGLDVSDRIQIEYSADDELSAAIESHRERVMADALAASLKRVQSVPSEAFAKDSAEPATRSLDDLSPVALAKGEGRFRVQIEGHELGINIRKA
jgi:hypothetical protein